MLLWYIIEKPCFDCPCRLSATCSWESPACTTFTLIFDRIYHILLSPVNFTCSFSEGCNDSSWCFFCAATGWVVHRTYWVFTYSTNAGICRILFCYTLAFSAFSSQIFTCKTVWSARTWNAISINSLVLARLAIDLAICRLALSWIWSINLKVSFAFIAFLRLAVTF